MMNKGKNTDVRSRQAPLRELYQKSPEEALITDCGRTADGVSSDPFHGFAKPGSKDYGVVWPFGIHRAIGGDHDAPNPGDMLCAALAACMDSTIRIIAGHLGVRLTVLEVEVAAEVDVRGCLLVDQEVPVGFQKMRCSVNLQTAEGTDPKMVKMLMSASEHSCVNMNTLRSGVPITTSLNGTNL